VEQFLAGLEFASMERRLIRVTSLVAFAIVLATDVLYIVAINAQGPSDQPYIPRFVGSYVAVMAALIAVSLLPRPEILVIRLPLRAAAAGGLFVLGFVAAFSIGPPLVLAGFLVLLALARTERPSGSRFLRLAGLVAAGLTVAVLIAGLDVTQRLVVCPETGTSGGSGAGILGIPYTYECNNGQLTFH
jgi:hypothetical protein